MENMPGGEGRVVSGNDLLGQKDREEPVEIFENELVVSGSR